MIRQQIERSGAMELLEKLRVPDKKQVFKVWQDRFLPGPPKAFGDETGLHPHQPNAEALELGNKTRGLAIFERGILRARQAATRNSYRLSGLLLSVC